MIRKCRLVALLLLFVLAAAAAYSQDRPRVHRPTGPPYRAGEVIIGFDPAHFATANTRVKSDLSATPVRTLSRLNAQVMRSAKAYRDLAGFCQAARKIPGVRYCEPNYMRRALLAAPNDPGYNEIDTIVAPFDYDGEGEATYYQWTLRQINALAGWSIFPNTYYTSATRPANAVKIAVIDTGIDTDNVDFINAGGSSTDVAQGGQIDFADARNVQSGAIATDIEDDYGHGTAVAGVLGAATNNGGSSGGQGIAGLGYHAQVMPVKALDATGQGTEADLANAITWAVDHGATIINISAGDYPYSQLEQDAVDYAWDHGTLVVAAAGNDGDSTRLYPASCAGVLAVAATSWPSDDTTEYSNNGEFVGVAAPGGDVSYFPLGFWLTWCLMPNSQVPMHDAGWEPGFEYYQYQAGTSVACPHVAGLAALYASHFGITQSTPGGVMRMFQAIQRGADDPAGVPGWSPYWGWGRINVEQTLLDANNRGSTVGCITGQLTYYDTPAANATVQARTPGTSTVISSATSRADGTFRIVNIAPGTYDIYASFYGDSGTVTGIQVVASADRPHVMVGLPLSGDPPTAPTSVAIAPEAPTSADDLTATATGGSGGYNYKWQSATAQGGPWTDGPTGAILTPASTARDQWWRVQACSTGGGQSSSWVNSTAVQISNAPPDLQSVLAHPPSPRSDSTLRGVPGDCTDADGDPISYRWYWEMRPGGTGNWQRVAETRTVGPEALTRGDQWRVSCRAHDGSDFSLWRVSDPVTIGNGRPTPPTSVFIKPTTPTTVSDLRAYASGGLDSDGDGISYFFRWYSSPNGVDWTAAGGGRTVDAALTTTGQHWRVAARAYDGQDSSGWTYSAPVIIGNAPPNRPTLVTITPASPGNNDDLVAQASGSVDPEGATVKYRYRWYSSLNGTDWTFEDTGPVIGSLSTTPGDWWRVAARAYDGTAFSNWKYSEAVRIGAPAAGAAAPAPTLLASAARSAWAWLCGR